MLNGIIQSILMAFSMKKYRARTGLLSSENDDFKFLKKAIKLCVLILINIKIVYNQEDDDDIAIWILIFLELFLHSHF